jgi:RNA polymerase sigma-70 factor (ECF subfamily)
MTREPFSATNERVDKMLAIVPTPYASKVKMTSEVSREVLLDCIAGRRAALGILVSCYERRVYAYLSRTLGPRYSLDDLAQEVFLRAYPALSRFDPEGAAKFSTWLLAIAHHVAIDARRRWRPEGEPLLAEGHASLLPSPEEQLQHEQLRAAVARAVEQLSDEQREVFVLATFHELTTEEIAQVVGAFEATVKTRLFRAKAKLRLLLGSRFEVTP